MTPSETKPVSQFIAVCLSRCREGFRNEFHWKNWLAKYRGEIDQLAEGPRKAILDAHTNSGPREPRLSRPQAQKGL